MDDGLILNITYDEPARPRAAVGSRRKSRKAEREPARNRVTQPVERIIRPQATKSSGHGVVRPTKRSRLDTLNGDNPKHTPFQPESSGPARSNQFISSLFTYNPEIVVPESTNDTAPKGPSNAPLKDKFTFSELELNPLIIAHLKKRMSINAPTSIQRASLANMLGNHNSTRDVFIQAQTGSGKTLAYLLPIIHSLLPLSSLSYIDRSIGTLAIIIAPTRELANQISDVLEVLLQLRLRPEVEDTQPEEPKRLARWLVSGVLTGGSTRTHEKARLRKGVPILVGTPGRLLDHLQNTESFNVGKCQWLVLDEADRLMELGFEETVKGIIRALDGRRNLAMEAAAKGDYTQNFGGWDWSRRRRTILCSATIRDHVQQLAGHALSDPVMIKGDELEAASTDAVIKPSTDAKSSETVAKFTPPSQLAQKYVTIPLKLRLVSLIALIRALIGNTSTNAPSSTRIIVFLSCTDSVDFHWRLLGGVSMSGGRQEASSDNESDYADKKISRPHESVDSMPISVKCALLPSTSIFRLHGNLPLSTRLNTVKAFSARLNNSIQKQETDVSVPSESAVLLCTSVASRGLDMPLVRAVIQYDLPTENGADEYVHRVGRTARAGRGGEAWSFVTPSETEWVPWIEKSMSDDETKAVKLEAIAVEEVLRRGFGGKRSEYEARATQVQLASEQWVLVSAENSNWARKAYQSHMRAYATHPSSEKHIFHVKNLHLGHLAKAFALRDAPNQVTLATSMNPKKKIGGSDAHGSRNSGLQRGKKRKAGESDDEDSTLTAVRMKEAIRRQGRLTKKGGMLVPTGTDEFQLASGSTLEKLVNRRV